MTCLITGGTGFIGSYVARRLVRSGERVVAYDIAPDLRFLESMLNPSERALVEAVRGDIVDLPLLVRTARQHGVDRVVHLAYILGRETELNPFLSTRVNSEGTVNVFEMATIVGARRVVWASSISAMGPKSAGPDGVIANEAPYHPNAIYGACKALNELVAHRYARSYGLEPVGLRFPVIYGPGAARGWARFVSEIVEDLVKGRPAAGPPRFQRETCWTYVDDIAEAVVAGLQSPRPHTLHFNLTGEVCTVADVLDKIAAHFPGAAIGTLEGYPELRLMPRYDATPAREELGWEPRHTVEDGIRECIEYYRRG